MIHVASSPLAFGNMRFVMAVVHDQVFYFQAEDGIRDGHVTGVQTCALPIFTGIGSGLGTVLGGVGGPAVTVYAVLSRWPVLPMVATMQPLWIIISSVSFASKWAWDDGQLPDMAWWVWLAIVVTVIVSIFLGEAVQKRLPERFIQRLVMGLGFLGALLALGIGVRLLVV